LSNIHQTSLQQKNIQQEMWPPGTFGRHGMPPPTSNDTGTALGQDGSDW